MVYYFKNKEGLFREVLRTLVYDSSSIKAVPEPYRLSLCTFYNYFIEILKRDQGKMKEMGIGNLNESLMQIENSALTYTDDFKILTQQWFKDEQDIWKKVIDNAISIGEIKPSIDSITFSQIFEECYLGHAFKGVFAVNGYDVDALKKEYDTIYELLKS